jgi:hypothetical protein
MRDSDSENKSQGTEVFTANVRALLLGESVEFLTLGLQFSRIVLSSKSLQVAGNLVKNIIRYIDIEDFLGTSAALNAWSTVNNATISVIADSTPLSNALPNALRVQIPSRTTGQSGVANTGFFGSFSS